MNTHIDHLIIAVPDLTQATYAYTVLLGRSPSWRGSHPDYGTANTLFRLDNTYIELLAPDGDGPAADIVSGLLQERGSCLGGLVFGTENAEAFVAHARKHGLAATDPVPGHGVEELSGAVRHWRSIFWDQSAARGIFSFCIEHHPESVLPMAVAADESAITGVDHVVVNTRSGEAAKSFYGDQLGIRLALEQHVPEWGGTQLFFRASSMSIEVIVSDKAIDQDALWGLALKVADLEITHERLLKSGVDISDIREGRKPGTRVCTAKSHTLAIPTILIEHTGA